MNSEAEPLGKLQLMPGRISLCIPYERFVIHRINRGGHSARVTVRLLVNGLCLPIRQMGPDFLLMEQPVNHPPAMASLELRVDESEPTWEIFLPKGIPVGSDRVAIEAVA